jgi:hypothetical protein
VATLDALLLCDSAARDGQTGKWTLVGVFDAVWAPQFPAVHQSMDVYFRLRVTTSAAVRLLCRPPAGAAHLLATISVTPAPRGLVEGAVRVAGLELAVPGEYRVELEVDDGVPLGATGLTVAALPPRSTPLH